MTLGNRFIAGGDYNAKHTRWGSRITSGKGTALLATIQAHNLSYISSGEPTYWPTDRNRLPDLLDFCITKGLNISQIRTQTSLDLSSDHSPVIVTVHSQIVRRQKQPTLYSRLTDWDLFRRHLDDLITLNIPLKTDTHIEYAVETLTKSIQTAAWMATPDRNMTQINESCPVIVREKIAYKRMLRKQWRMNRTAANKQKLNKASTDLKNLLYDLKNQGLQEYLENLSASEANNYSLWKATKRIKRPQQSIPPIMDASGQWARDGKEKAAAFANYLDTVFQPYHSDEPEHDDEVAAFLNVPFQMTLPACKFKLKEVQAVITREINPKKAPGYDLITGKVLQEITKKCLKAITQIFNSILRLGHFPHQWKVAQIVMLPKPGKPMHAITSYRPISLLPLLSKVFEKRIQTQHSGFVNNNEPHASVTT